MKAEEFRAAGLDPFAARQTAIRAIDGLIRHEEACPHTRRVNLVMVMPGNFRCWPAIWLPIKSG
jgi:hypothetical protein